MSYQMLKFMMDGYAAFGFAANVDGLLLCWNFIIVSLATEAD
jgi:hypothetical protein